MSDLQLALIALGAVIVAAVILYNWWQERRLMRDSSWHFEAPADDALLEHSTANPFAGQAEQEAESFRIDEPITIQEPVAFQDTIAEPASSEDAEPPQTADAAAPMDLPGAEVPAAQEPVAAAAEPMPEVPATTGPMADFTVLPAALDENIDTIALLRFAQPLAASAVQAACGQLNHADKPRQCLLQDTSGAWHALAAEAGAGQLLGAACALQLADRGGPVAETGLRQFRDEIQKLAAGLDAGLEWRGAENALAYATELDQFCVEVDVMVGFHLVPGENGPFAGTKLRGLAEASGMQLDASGAFHYDNEAGATLFTMISHDKRPFRPETLRTLFYRGLSFQLDVPRVANCSEAFSQMVQAARKMQVSLGGQLVDDNQRALGDADIDKIRQQLKAIQTRMAARGIQPGSPTALRLFS